MLLSNSEHRYTACAYPVVHLCSQRHQT